MRAYSERVTTVRSCCGPRCWSYSGTNYPKESPNAARVDSWPPEGGPPGSSLPFLKEQLLDEWGIDGARLCVANAVDAHELGAEIRDYLDILRSRQRVQAIIKEELAAIRARNPAS